MAWALLLAIGVGSMPGPWSAHLRPDVEALEYQFLSDVIEELPQNGILVKVPQGPGISSYVPRTLFLQRGRSYRIIDVVALRELIARGEVGDTPVYFYRGLGYAWLEYLAFDAGLAIEPSDRDGAREVLSATERGLAGFRTEEVARRRLVRQVSPAAGYRMDFNELPGPYVDVVMVRLLQD